MDLPPILCGPKCERGDHDPSTCEAASPSGIVPSRRWAAGDRAGAKRGAAELDDMDARATEVPATPAPAAAPAPKRQAPTTAALPSLRDAPSHAPGVGGQGPPPGAGPDPLVVKTHNLHDEEKGDVWTGEIMGTLPASFTSSDMNNQLEAVWLPDEGQATDTPEGPAEARTEDLGAASGPPAAAVDTYNQAVDGDVAHSVRSGAGPEGVPAVMAGPDLSALDALAALDDAPAPEGPAGDEDVAEGLVEDELAEDDAESFALVADGWQGGAQRDKAADPDGTAQTLVADGQQGATPIVAEGLSLYGASSTGDAAPTMLGGQGGNLTGGVQTFQVEPESGQGADLKARPTEVAPSLTSNSSQQKGGDRGAFVASEPDPALAGMVRRLTPLECERLQGFPDGWTDGEADSARYRMLGNAVCVNVAEWLGRRLLTAHLGADPNDPERPLWDLDGPDPGPAPIDPEYRAELEGAGA